MSDKTDSLDDFRPSESIRDDGKASPGAGPVTTFRFATFNILHGRIPGGRFDLPALRSSIQSLEADVFGLQEVDKRMIRSRFCDITAALATAAGMHSLFAPVRRRYDAGLYGNALLARAPLREVRRIKLFRRSWRRERRGAVIATVDLNGHSCRVATTHLSLFRDESELQLRWLLTELARHPGPAVLLGDFNRRPHEVLPLVKELGWKVLASDHTYPAENPKLCLDYVVVKGCVPIAAQVIETPVSDHRALCVTVSFIN